MQCSWLSSTRPITTVPMMNDKRQPSRTIFDSLGLYLGALEFEALFLMFRALKGRSRYERERMSEDVHACLRMHACVRRMCARRRCATCVCLRPSNPWHAQMTAPQIDLCTHVCVRVRVSMRLHACGLAHSGAPNTKKKRSIGRPEHKKKDRTRNSNRSRKGTHILGAHSAAPMCR